MRVIIALVAIATLGCTATEFALATLSTAQMFNAIGDLSDAVQRVQTHDAAERAQGELRKDELRVPRLIEESRSRLVDPRCELRVRRLDVRTWVLVSCEREVKCWALTHAGYDCQPPLPALPADQPQL